MEETVWEQYSVTIQRVWNYFTLTYLVNTVLRVTCLEMWCRRAAGLWTRSFMLVAKEATEHTLHRWMALITNRLEPPVVPRLDTQPASLTHKHHWCMDRLWLYLNINNDHVYINIWFRFYYEEYFFFIPVYTTVQKFGEWKKSLIFNKAVFIWPKIL